MKKLFTYISVLAFSAILIASCGKYRDEVEKPDTLYTRLGGDSSIRRIGDKFVEYAILDTVVNRFLKKTVDNNRVDDLKLNTGNFIIEVSGGPELYTGENLYALSDGKDIQHRHCDAFIEDLKRAMEFYNVHQNEKDELVKIFNSMRSQVVRQQ